VPSFGASWACFRGGIQDCRMCVHVPLAACCTSSAAPVGFPAEGLVSVSFRMKMMVSGWWHGSPRLCVYMGEDLSMHILLLEQHGAAIQTHTSILLTRAYDILIICSCLFLDKMVLYI